MCNKLHSDFIPIPERGRGYKLLNIERRTGKIFLPYKIGKQEEVIFDKWYHWNPFYFPLPSRTEINPFWDGVKTGTTFFEYICYRINLERNHGFTFFLDKEWAIMIKNYMNRGYTHTYKPYSLFPCYYNRGLGRQHEHEMIYGLKIPIALCKDICMFPVEIKDKPVTKNFSDLRKE